VAKHDHTHRVDTGTPVALGPVIVAGTSDQVARADHVHPYPTAVEIGADPAGSATAALNDAYSYTDGQLSGHEGAADPHTGYQKESEKAAANGYASLDATGKVPASQLPPMTSRVIQTISANTTLGAVASTDYVYLCSAALTATLPTAVGNTNRYTVKRTGTGTVTIDTTSSQTIDGATTFAIGVQYQSVDLISDGANWSVI
jgi:hypothetical protein